MPPIQAVTILLVLVRPLAVPFCPGPADPLRIEGAAVTLTCGSQSVTATTDAEGLVRLAKPPPPPNEACTLTVTAPKYLSWAEPISPSLEQQDVQLARPAKVVLSAVDGAGHPLEGTEIHVSGGSATEGWVAGLEAGIRVLSDEQPDPSNEITLRIPKSGLMVADFPASHALFSTSGSAPLKQVFVCPGSVTPVTFVVDASSTLEAQITFTGPKSKWGDIGKVLVLYDDGDTGALYETKEGYASNELHPGDARVLVQGNVRNQVCARVHLEAGKTAHVSLTLTPDSRCTLGVSPNRLSAPAP